jgi:transcriptional regulator NrdR family protein
MPSTSREEEIRCPANGCFQIFSALSDLEQHYSHSHNFQCATCSIRFSTFRALEVHLEEEHSQFFAAQLSLYPNRPHFECFATPRCSERFISKELRDEHCANIHLLTDQGRAKEIDRKVLSDLEKSLQSTQISNEVRFGDEQERMFNRSRKKLTAKRILK